MDPKTVKKMYHQIFDLNIDQISKSDFAIELNLAHVQI